MIALDLLRAGAVTVAAAPALVLLRKASGRVRHAAFAAALAASAIAPFAVGLVPRRVVEITPALPRLGRSLGVSEGAAREAPPALPASLRTTPPSSKPWRLPEGAIFLPALLPLARMAHGWRTARRWAKRATPGPDGALLSDDAPAPMTFFDGLRHRILLPAEAAGWPEGRRRVVLLHERAHIERGDWWTQTAARTIVAFQWMNPLAWWMLRGLADAAEECADQAALRSGMSPQAYARELLALALPGPRPAGSLPMTPKTDVGRRIVTVLKGQRSTSRWALPLAALVPLALVLPAAALGGRGTSIRVAGHQDTVLRREATEDAFGNAANGWTAGLPGVGKAKLEYVVGWFKGTPVAWMPDGTRIPVAGLPIAPVRPAPEYAYDAAAKRSVKTGRGAMGETMFVIGFDDPTGVMEAGTQSASGFDGPATASFGRGSWTTDPGKPGRRYTAGFVAYPRGYENVGGRTAFTDAVGFAAGPVDARTIFSFDETKGATMTPNPSGIPGFQADGFSFQEVPGKKGLDLVVKMKKVGGDVLKQPWLVAVATGRDGRVDTQSPFLQYEGPKALAHPFYRYPLPRARAEYRSIEILAGSTATTEFRDVALLPSSALRSDVGRTRVTQLSVARAHLGKTEEELVKLTQASSDGKRTARAKVLQRTIADDREQIALFEDALARIVTESMPKE